MRRSGIYDHGNGGDSAVLKIVLTIMVLLLCQPAGAEIYKWVDDAGRVHFSDTAAKNQPAEKVQVQVNSYQSASLATPQKDTAAPARPVIMYSTSWCGYCKKARRHFNAGGIAFTEFDIEKDMRAKRKYDAIGGQGVPVILIGRQRMNGFSAARFDKMYQSPEK